MNKRACASVPHGLVWETDMSRQCGRGVGSAGRAEGTRAVGAGNRDHRRLPRNPTLRVESRD